MPISVKKNVNRKFAFSQAAAGLSTRSKGYQKALVKKSSVKKLPNGEGNGVLGEKLLNCVGNEKTWVKNLPNGVGNDVFGQKLPNCVGIGVLGQNATKLIR